MSTTILETELGWVAVGTPVSFELAPNGFPRWHMGVDRGPSGKYAPGVIESVKHGVIYVRSTVFVGDENPQVILWRWPLPGHPEYRADLWEQCGYLCPLRF